MRTICTTCNGEGSIFHDDGPQTNCHDCEGFGEYEVTDDVIAKALAHLDALREAGAHPDDEAEAHGALCDLVAAMDADK